MKKIVMEIKQMSIRLKKHAFIHSSATISAPPTTNNAGNVVGSANPEQAKAPSMVAATGTTSKIMHPPEDLSLEEIRARKPKYLKKVWPSL